MVARPLAQHDKPVSDKFFTEMNLTRMRGLPVHGGGQT